MTTIDDTLRIALINLARQAAGNSYSPYSKFPVGTALITSTDVIITGCNVENASYGLTMCAERVAIFQAVADGHRDIIAIAIAGGMDQPAAPCGACRQVMLEHCAPQTPIFFTTLKSGGEIITTTVEELLPHGFTL